MKTLLISAALAATVLPTAVAAQAIPGAVIAVVDLEKVTSQCNACRTATAALRSQATGLQSRQQALVTPSSLMPLYRRFHEQTILRERYEG